MKKISLKTLCKLIDTGKAENYKLENIENLPDYDELCNYRIALTDIDTQELYICDYRFYHVIKGCWWDEIVKYSNIETDEAIELKLGEIIYLPVYQERK